MRIEELELQSLSEALSKSGATDRNINPKTIFNVDLLVTVCANLFGIKENLIVSQSRKTEAVWSRYFIYKHLRDNTLLSLGSIGARLGSKDHSTVLHGLTTHSRLIEVDRDYRMMAEEFESQVN